MIITLNGELEETVPYEYVPDGQDKIVYNQKNFVSRFIRNFEAKSQYKKFKVIYGPLPDKDIETQDGYLWMVSKAYSNHRSLTVNPHDLWYMVLTELAAIIKAHPEQFRPLFTTSPEKVNIIMNTPSDVTQINIDEIMFHLKRLVPSNTELFVPNLTTLNQKSRYALHAAFADAVQHYYNYMTLACGIKEINLTGTKEDWEKLFYNVGEIKRLFNSVGFEKADGYLKTVQDIFENIHRSYLMDMTDFWKNIYSHRNVGSGGEKKVDGWIANLYYDQKNNKLENFRANWAVVPYTNCDTGRTFVAVNGCFLSAKDVDGFYSSGYDQFVLETFQQ